METQRKKERERWWEREIFRNRDGDERERERERGEEAGEERGRAHQAKRSAVAVYFPMPS